MSVAQGSDFAEVRRQRDAGGLTDFGKDWDQSRRAEGVAGRSLELDDISMTSEFEGGNGMDMGRIGPNNYFVRCEPDPGEHRFSGKSYYFCFAIRNPEPLARVVTIRIAAAGWNYFGAQTRHYVLRRGDSYLVVGAEACREVMEQPDWVDIDVHLPAGTEASPTVVLSNFHWNRYQELLAWLPTLEGSAARVVPIGSSRNGLPLHAVEIGDNPDAPCIVIAQTSQPSELGATLVLKAQIEHLCQDNPHARELREKGRFRFVPMTNPDGHLAGLTVSDTKGHFPVFEADRAVQKLPDTPPETEVLWNYLVKHNPAIYWEWHTNNWSRRPGHMLLRYRHELITDPVRQQHWIELEDALLRLLNTHHENFTSHTEGPYQPTMGFQATIQLGAISTMIKNHENLPIQYSLSFGVSCLELAAAQLMKMSPPPARAHVAP